MDGAGKGMGVFWAIVLLCNLTGRGNVGAGFTW